MSNSILVVAPATHPISLILTAAGQAAAGAATGAVGSAVLKDAGHAGYDALTGARHGAIGGAILGIPAALLLHTLAPRDAKGQRDGRLDIIVTAGLAAADGALGAAVLQSAHHMVDQMTAGRSAAACATGSAVFTGAAIALGVLITAFSLSLGCRVTVRCSDMEMA